MFILKPKSKRDEEEEKKEGGSSLRGKGTINPGQIRLQKELADLDLPGNVVLTFPDKKNVMEFNLKIHLTDDDCLWKGATYHFKVEVLATYPYEAPKCHCETKVYHPNIDLDGNVCLNILRADWKPVLGINAVIMGLLFLFIEPNPNDPLNHEAAELMRTNIYSFNENVRKTVRGGYVAGQKFPKLI